MPISEENKNRLADIANKPLTYDDLNTLCEIWQESNSCLTSFFKGRWWLQGGISNTIRKLEEISAWKDPLLTELERLPNKTLYLSDMAHIFFNLIGPREQPHRQAPEKKVEYEPIENRESNTSKIMATLISSLIKSLLPFVEKKIQGEALETSSESCFLFIYLHFSAIAHLFLQEERDNIKSFIYAMDLFSYKQSRLSLVQQAFNKKGILVNDIKINNNPYGKNENCPYIQIAPYKKNFIERKINTTEMVMELTHVLDRLGLQFRAIFFNALKYNKLQEFFEFFKVPEICIAEKIRVLSCWNTTLTTSNGEYSLNTLMGKMMVALLQVEGKANKVWDGHQAIKFINTHFGNAKWQPEGEEKVLTILESQTTIIDQLKIAGYKFNKETSNSDLISTTPDSSPYFSCSFG